MTALAIVLKKVYKYFDLNDFKIKSEAKEIPFTPAETLAEAHERVGGDEKVLLKALNSYLKAEVLKAAEAEVTSKGGKKSVVLAICKPFRALPPWNAMFKMTAEVIDGVPTGKMIPEVSDGEKVIDREKQTAAILDIVKSNEAMLNAIRAGSAQASEDDEDENDGEDNG
jgi:hypothetical protein